MKTAGELDYQYCETLTVLRIRNNNVQSFRIKFETTAFFASLSNGSPKGSSSEIQESVLSRVSLILWRLFKRLFNF